MTPEQQFEETKRMIAEAVANAKMMFSTNPAFAVIMCVPSGTLAEFVIAVSSCMQQMAQASLDAQRQNAREQGHGE